MKSDDLLIKELRRQRLAKGLSLRELGRHIGVSFSTLARLERGEGYPDTATCERMIRWLETGEGSMPFKRQPAGLSWQAKIEQRLDAIEAALGALRKDTKF